MIEGPKIQNREAKAGYDIVYLVACTLQGIVPKQCHVESMDLNVLYHMSKNHSLTTMVYTALESANTFLDCKELQLIKRWKDEKEKAVRKNLLLDAERNEILCFMERVGIWYMPLKGILLKEMYPKLGMRQMADNDILYDNRYQKELFEFMTARGYKACLIGKGNHDIYQKDPIYNYELHTALYGAAHDRNWEEYYVNVKQRLLKDEDNRFGYHFKDEDFYIYIMTHAYKHYNSSGTGLRSLIDFYVFLQSKEAGLKWNYISGELERLQITEFERESRELCKKIFSDRVHVLTQKEMDMLTYYIGSGTYGTMKNSIEKKLRKYQSNGKGLTIVTKLKYCLGRVIPNMDHYKNYAPFVYRHKWLIPFYLVFRVIRGLVQKRNKIGMEIHEVRKATNG